MSDASLIADLLDCISADSCSDAAFNTMALRIFAHQFAHCPAIAAHARSRGRTPRTVKHWTAIPPIPIAAFKSQLISCTPIEQAAAVFMTSGTTDPSRRGRSVHATLAVYDASMRRQFRDRFLPDHDRMTMGVLFPPPELLPHSSLAHYLGLAREHFGTAASTHLVGANGLDSAQLLAFLDRAEASDAPVALLGASFSLVHALDAISAAGRQFRLPAGSRILDTGGFKGQSRSIDQEAFLAMLEAGLGVPRARCINMYGMTELSTQFYDRGNAVSPAVRTGPHWARTCVVDPISAAPVTHGETGVLAHLDLAHVNCAVRILTEDAGYACDDGFVLLGRVGGAEALGCSAAADAFLQAARGAAAP